jgi:hypothetical protein
MHLTACTEEYLAGSDPSGKLYFVKYSWKQRHQEFDHDIMVSATCGQANTRRCVYSDSFQSKSDAIGAAMGFMDARDKRMKRDLTDRQERSHP